MRSSRIRANKGFTPSDAPAAKRGRAKRRLTGFTLIEVVFAMAIIAIVTTLLLGKRDQVIRDAATTRDARMGWTLAAWKMGLIERDERLFLGEGDSQSGTFEEYAPDYKDFFWEYEAAKEDVPTNDPDNREEKPSKIFRVKLRVSRGAEPPLIELEGLFPVQKPPQAAPKEELPPPVK